MVMLIEYNPNIDYFTHYHHSLSKLNNRYNLISLCKKKNRIKTADMFIKHLYRIKKRILSFTMIFLLKNYP